jgi:hypothetical protein
MKKEIEKLKEEVLKTRDIRGIQGFLANLGEYNDWKNKQELRDKFLKL